MVLVEHHVRLVMRVSDVVTVLDAGRVIATGPPDRVRRDPRVIVSVQDRHQPQSYAVFHGKMRTITEEGARAHIDKLAKRFLGVDKYPGPPTETRLLVRIAVDRISGAAPGYKSWT